MNRKEDILIVENREQNRIIGIRENYTERNSKTEITEYSIN